MYFILKRHARTRMLQRGVSQDEVERAIRFGGRTIQSPDRQVATYGHLRVVFRQTGEVVEIITVTLRWRI